MGDLLKQGSQWLQQQQREYCSSPVLYRRGANELLVNAMLGRTEYELEDDYGLRIRSQVMDFLILAEEFSPTFDQPEVGDRIVVDGSVYEVMPLSGQGHWRWSDPYRTMMRIHTRQMGQA